MKISKILKIKAKELVEKTTNNRKPKLIVLYINLIFEYNKIIRSKFNKKAKDISKSHISNFWNLANKIENKQKIEFNKKRDIEDCQKRKMNL